MHSTAWALTHSSCLPFQGCMPKVQYMILVHYCYKDAHAHTYIQTHMYMHIYAHKTPSFPPP